MPNLILANFAAFIESKSSVPHALTYPRYQEINFHDDRINIFLKDNENRHVLPNEYFKFNGGYPYILPEYTNVLLPYLSKHDSPVHKISFSFSYYVFSQQDTFNFMKYHFLNESSPIGRTMNRRMKMESDSKEDTRFYKVVSEYLNHFNENKSIHENKTLSPYERRDHRRCENLTSFDFLSISHQILLDKRTNTIFITHGWNQRSFDKVINPSSLYPKPLMNVTIRDTSVYISLYEKHPEPGKHGVNHFQPFQMIQNKL